MSSETTICNLALAKLGEGHLETLDDDSTVALQCKLMYPTLRDAVLEDHTWRFALARATLAPLAAAPDWGWAYKFVLPTDPYCLRPVEIADDYDTPWEQEGRYLLCDSASVQLRYIARVTDVSQFTAQFTDCLAERLAAELGYFVTGARSTWQAHFQMYQLKLQQARNRDSHGGTPRALPQSTYFTVRR
jgi:hypothetical protein